METRPDTPRLLAFFKAMANESRLKIIALIADRERSVQDIARELGLKEPTVSHHLAALKAIGLVRARAEGVTHWHKLDHDALTAFNRALFEGAAIAPPEAEEDRVAANYLEPDGTLARLPAVRKKLWLVLKFLMRGFEEGRRYKEAEVNAILQRRHWDSATLRREMVGYKMLAREKGVYWRLPDAQWEGV